MSSKRKKDSLRAPTSGYLEFSQVRSLASQDGLYFPMQKRLKMVPKTSSVVISPVMLPR